MSWKKVKISDIFTVARGGSPRPIEKFLTEDKNGINWIMIGDTVSGNKYIEHTAKKIIHEGVKNSRIVNSGDFLLTNSMSFGRPYILKTSGCIHDGWLVLSPKRENLSRDFFYYYLGSDLMKLELSKLASGAVVKNLNKELVSNLSVCLPPLEQQKKIASILDAADAYRQKTKALIAKYDELTQSLFLDMFGDPVRNEKGWGIKKLGDITSMKAGKFIAASKIYSENSSNLQPCFGGNGLRGYVTSYTHDGEFVLIGRQGALCGNVKITSGKFHATEHAIVCTPKIQYNVLWLYYLLMLMNLNRFSTGAAQPGLNVGTLVDLEVYLVPFILQNQFAERVEAIEQQKAQAQASLEKAEELFNSLLQRAFKGELV